MIIDSVCMCVCERGGGEQGRERGSEGSREGGRGREVAVFRWAFYNVMKHWYDHTAWSLVAFSKFVQLLKCFNSFLEQTERSCIFFALKRFKNIFSFV